MPHPGPQARSSLVDNAACVGCHAEIGLEWSASLHRRAHDVPEFLRAYAREPQAFCRACHAPEVDATIGVACVTCHVTTAGVLAAPHADARTLARSSPRDRSRADAAHPILADARFATDAACASCHEFAFPRNPSAQMQATVSEHRVSAFADISCAACHMPRVADARGEHRSHAFPASRDPAMLRAAAHISARRVSASALEVTIAPGRVGHAMPTGDLFRRLLVRAQAVDDDHLVVSEASTALGRRFLNASVEIADDRVGRVAKPREPTRVRLELGAVAMGKRWTWSVRYQRVAFPRGNGSGDVLSVVLDGETVLESGSMEASDAAR